MEKQGRVLVVDDLEKWREQLVESLRAAGFYAQSAATTAEALQQLEEDLYHIVVMDIRMEDANPRNVEGLDLLKEFQRRDLSGATK